MFLRFILAAAAAMFVTTASADYSRALCQDAQWVLDESHEYWIHGQLTDEVLTDLVSQAGMSPNCLQQVYDSQGKAYPMLVAPEGDYVFGLRDDMVFQARDDVDPTIILTVGNIAPAAETSRLDMSKLIGRGKRIVLLPPS